MTTCRMMMSVAALAGLLSAFPAAAGTDRTGMGPKAGPATNDPDAPNPVARPSRDATSIPGAMENPNAGYRGPKDESGATESGNARLPTGGERNDVRR